MRKKNLSLALCASIVQPVVSNIVDPLNRPAHYLPADRTGVMHAHRVVVRSLIASASRSDSPMPEISGVLGDFLEQLVEMASSTRRKAQDDNALALRMEQALLRGTVLLNGQKLTTPHLSIDQIAGKRTSP